MRYVSIQSNSHLLAGIHAVILANPAVRFEVRHLHSYTVLSAPKYTFAAFCTAVVLVRRPANPAIHRARKFDDQGHQRTELARLDWIYVHSYFSLSPPFNNGPALHARIFPKDSLTDSGCFSFLHFGLSAYSLLFVSTLLHRVGNLKFLKICNPTIAHHVGQAHSVRRRDWASYAGQPGKPRHAVKGHPIS